METSLKDILETYYNHEREMHLIIDRMKEWLIENYKRVDWSEMSIYIYNSNTEHNENKKKSEWFRPKYNYNEGGKINDIIKDYFEGKENPIKTLTCVLDECDYDFSVTINGKGFWWIPDVNVVTMYSYGIDHIKSV